MEIFLRLFDRGALARWIDDGVVEFSFDPSGKISTLDRIKSLTVEIEVLIFKKPHPDEIKLPDSPD